MWIRLSEFYKVPIVLLKRKLSSMQFSELYKLYRKIPTPNERIEILLSDILYSIDCLVALKTDNNTAKVKYKNLDWFGISDESINIENNIEQIDEMNMLQMRALSSVLNSGRGDNV